MFCCIYLNIFCVIFDSLYKLEIVDFFKALFIVPHLQVWRYFQSEIDPQVCSLQNRTRIVEKLVFIIWGRPKDADKPPQGTVGQASLFSITQQCLFASRSECLFIRLTRWQHTWNLFPYDWQNEGESWEDTCCRPCKVWQTFFTHPSYILLSCGGAWLGYRQATLHNLRSTT